MRFIFLLALFLFGFFPQIVFAADFTVAGKIIDSKNNPIAQGVVVFTNTSGKITASATSDNFGLYETSVTQGSYTIEVNGPKGSNVQGAKLENVTINSSTNFDFTLIVPEVIDAKKPTILQSVAPIIVSGVLILLLLIGIGIYLKKRKALSQSSSSH